MSEKKRVGIIGATGTVGQHFVLLLQNHPYFELTVLAASKRSAGVKYKDAVEKRWSMKEPIPESVKEMTVMDAEDISAVAPLVDFIFCAVNMKKADILRLEEAYAKAEIPVVSNNSANR
ncbi:MAG: aspartate-semialdehyde dehydrogenase, partial [Clostridia bacterium]|nr:aspartate-semialdehyde dehydrogenase [Clostridia bacterium]